MDRLRRYLRRPAMILGGATAGLALAGLLYAEAGHHQVRQSIVDALFVGGAVIVTFAGLAGGGGRGQRLRRGATPSPMPFGELVVGLLVIGIGVGVLKA